MLRGGLLSRKFSIGEVARIHNLSIQTLRHYDTLGILKPAFVNEDTGYRYYSVNQFLTIDLIKQCKAMGLSLDEIREIIKGYTSPESILDIINKQKNIIDKKIHELNIIKNNITFLEDGITRALEEGINKITITNYGEREFIRYDNVLRYTEAFEIKLSEVLADVERTYNFYNKELAFEMPFKDFQANGTLNYNNMIMRFTEGVPLDKGKITVLKPGRYLTLNFDDDHKEPKKYYDRILSYIESNNLQVIGDFYEIYVITRRTNDKKEKSLGKIQILLKD